MSEIPNPKMYNTKRYRDNYEDIEWRTRGTYCENCGANLKEPFGERHKEWYRDGTFCWVCRPGEDCNFNKNTARILPSSLGGR